MLSFKEFTKNILTEGFELMSLGDFIKDQGGLKKEEEEEDIQQNEAVTPYYKLDPKIEQLKRSYPSVFNKMRRIYYDLKINGYDDSQGMKLEYMIHDFIEGLNDKSIRSVDIEKSLYNDFIKKYPEMHDDSVNEGTGSLYVPTTPRTGNTKRQADLAIYS
jgi:hypothetical protein